MADSKIVSVFQTEDEVKIIIELTRFSSTKPVVVLLNNFIKFNCPPVYFESFLWGEIDEDASVCRLLKKQARILLKKKECGLWPNILEKVPRQESYQRKVELNEVIVERTQKEAKERSERFDATKKEKLQFQIDRDMSVHEKVKQFNEASVSECMGDSSKTNQPNDEEKQDSISAKECKKIVPERENRKLFKYIPPPPMNSIRKSAKIDITFSDYNAPTPKRESQVDGSRNNLPPPNVTMYS